jgi:ABC-type transporter Mla maintaining outer membrane lipid asymmetry permease subunit MlaE
LTDQIEHRHTETFPLVQRGGIRFFRRMSRATIGTFRGIGQRVLFLREIRRALAEPQTYLPLVIPQMRAIGVDSVPLAIMVAAFI